MHEITFIEQTLRDMAVYVRERYAERERLYVTSKRNPNDLLTEVDIAVQEETSSRLEQAFPGDVLVGEESGRNIFPMDPDSRAWVMDPIDGTQNFVRGLFPLFGISLAFVSGGELVAGGVVLPMVDELFLAERGSGAFRNGRRLKVSEVPLLSLARVEVDFGGAHVRERTLEAAPKLIRQAGQIRCHCAAVIGLCSIASGDSDAYVHVGLNPWDYAASVLIIEEAGGRTSLLDGTPLRIFGEKHDVAASNALIHEELLSALR